MSSLKKQNLHLREELALLEHHRQTTQLVVASLVASRERLMALPDDVKRERLIELQEEAIRAADKSLEFSESVLTHLRCVQSLYAGAA